MPATKTKFGLLLFLTQWVVYSEAWFWSWSGTTTRLPQTLEYEGSGSPTGSGELPSEITTKAEGDMVHEGHGTPNIKQTWVLTTEDPQMSTVTPATLRETDDASESVTARIPPQSTSGNGTSTLTALGSDPSRILKNASKIESEVELAVELDSKHGGFSSSGLLPVAENMASLVYEDGAVKQADRRGLDNASGAAFHVKKVGLRLSERVSTIASRVDEEQDLLGTQSESFSSASNKQNVDFASNAFNGNSHKNLKGLLTLILGNGDHTVAKSQGALDATAAHQNILGLQSRNAHRILSTMETSVMTPKPIFGQTKIYNENPKTKVVTIATQPHSGCTLDAPLPLKGKQEFSKASVRAVGIGKGIHAQTENASSISCLVLDAALPFCSSKFGETFAVPNYFNHSSLEEVQALLKEWAWLLESRCHHSLEWFFCLLLVPKCDPATPMLTLPCRSFCEVLLDSCWALLEGQHLPVECHTLPDASHGYQCLSVCNQNGNLWFKMQRAIHFDPVLKPPPPLLPNCLVFPSHLNAVNFQQIINSIQNNCL